MKIAIVIPAYNEEQTLGSLIQQLKNANFKNVLVVDDGSTDKTAFVALKSRVSVLTLPFNLGIAGAREAGLRYAQENDYDIVVQMDADGQHEPKYISDLIKPLIKNEVDVVVGSRFLKHKFENQTSRSRYLGISLLSFILSFLTSRKITDPTSGFSAYNKKAVKFLVQNYPSDYPEPEIPLLLKRGGFRFKEISIEARSRKSGRSSISYKNTLYYLGKVLLGIFVTCLRKIEGQNKLKIF